MATPPRPRPTLYQRLKRGIDQQLASISRRLGRPIEAVPDNLGNAPSLAGLPQPANAADMPAVFQQSFAASYADALPNLHELVYHLRQVRVAWHGTVLKGLRVFVPSLPYPSLEAELAGLFLLRQLRVRPVPALAAGPVGLVFDSYSGNYFHWIAEAVPRLAMLRKVSRDCVVLLPGPNPPAYVTESVRALGFERTHVLIPSELAPVSELVLPVKPGRHGYLVPGLMVDAREAIINYYAASLRDARPASRRVFVSRSRQQWRFLTNEAEVVAMLQRYGFETLYFEDLSFAEQVRAMYETDMLVGIHGANMTNLLFMTPGSQVLEMMSPTYVNPSYLSMAQSVGINYWLVPALLGSPSDVEHNYADITADLAVLEHVLCQACACSRTESLRTSPSITS